MNADHQMTKGQKDYPDETEGSRLAAQNRAACNKLQDSERGKLLDYGMQLINGGDAPKTPVHS